MNATLGLANHRHLNPSPDHMTLGVATSHEALDRARWIDPAVLEKAGILAEEASRFKAPAAYEGPSPAPQPPYDPSKPHMAYPPEMHRQMLKLPDAVITKSGSYTAAPISAKAPA